MISSFRNFAKSKFAGLLVFIMIIPFVFWGMGGMFSSGNSNNIAKINKTNISTQEFIDYLNDSGIAQETIRKNLDNNIIEELLSSLVSTTLLDLEIMDYNLLISESTILKKIKKNKNFLDDKGIFQRTKYEKFLLENNQTAPQFELRLKKRELQKNLFDYIGAGTVSPKFLIKKLYEEENKELEIEYFNLDKVYEKKENISNESLNKFVNENIDQLKEDYIDFSYAVINPKSLIGVDEFNQSYFDKIDQIEIDISNEIEFKDILSNLNISSINKTNFKFSIDENEIEKKIFELRNNRFDLFESENNYVLYKVNKIEKKEPDLNNKQTRSDIRNLVYQKNKFDYNNKLLKKITSKKFDNSDFKALGLDKIKFTKLNSIRDNNMFNIDAIKILYSLPINSFTLINDENNNIYLAKTIKYKNKPNEISDDSSHEYKNKQGSKNKNTLLKTYDLFLNNKYDVVLNQKTIERVKNFFQ
jgi:peptidyl-prolyl cis-trans isomerase D